MPSILHITDTHLHASPEGLVSGWKTQASLDAVLEHVARNGEVFDAVLVTGDLVHDESRAGYERLAGQLAGLGATVCVLPGNHDNPRVLQSGMGAGPAIRVLSPIVLDEWRVIPLNSHVNGQVWGKIGEAQLRTLEKKLDACREHVLLAVHHPPVAIGSPWMDRMGLADGKELMQLCEHHSRVRGIVFGHVHQACETTRGPIRLYATPSTCRQFMPGSSEYAEGKAAPGYRLIHLGLDGKMTTRVQRVAEARSEGR